MSKNYGRSVAAVLLLALLAACGPTGERGASTSGTSAAGGEATSAAAAETAAPEGTTAMAEATTPADAATDMTAETTPAETMAEETATTMVEETATTMAEATGMAGTTTAAAGGTADLASLSGNVVIDGSSTVEPISLAVAEEFKNMAPNVNVAVGRSGTGGGFEKFCNGETDISDASRKIRDEEAEKCTAKNIEPVELQVGVDALAVVTNSGNTFLNCLTADQIVKIFQEGGATNWNEIDPSFPNKPIQIFAPGADSGTFDYFVEHFELRGQEENEPAFKGQYTASEDDNVLVQGIQGSQDAIGFFGYAYFAENQGNLKAIQIDQEGDGNCVAPSPETVADNSYPLSRPLFIYPSRAALKEKPQVRAFVEYYMSDEGLQLVEEVDYFPATEEQAITARQNLASALQ